MNANKTIRTREWWDGRIDLLERLIHTAQETQGAEVWRLLFAEALCVATSEREKVR
jgi:hypothetical protein